MKLSLAEVAAVVGGEIIGDSEVIISGVAGIEEATEGQLTFLSNAKYIPLLNKTRASAVICSRNVIVSEKNLVLVSNPSLAFSQAADLFLSEQRDPFRGIHSTAVIAEDVTIGKEVSIGPCAVIERGARIGNHSTIGAGTFIGQDVVIGERCFLFPNVSILFRSQIGNGVIIHSGTVLGSDGFGYERIDGRQVKIPQIGIVVVENDVEIGANVTIDRARFHQTRIGEGTKIDNLVQIAHNVTIGKHCVIVAQVAISGSTRLEDGVILAGQVGVAGHLTIGRNAVVGAQSGVSKSLSANQTYFGYPAKPIALAKRLQAAQSRLTVYVDMIHDLRKRVQDLENKGFSGASD